MLYLLNFYIIQVNVFIDEVKTYSVDCIGWSTGLSIFLSAMYLTKYGEMSLITLIQSHTEKFNKIGGLETNHKYMKIEKLPVYGIESTNNFKKL